MVQELPGLPAGQGNQAASGSGAADAGAQPPILPDSRGFGWAAASLFAGIQLPANGDRQIHQVAGSGPLGIHVGGGGGRCSGRLLDFKIWSSGAAGIG